MDRSYSDSITQFSLGFKSKHGNCNPDNASQNASCHIATSIPLVTQLKQVKPTQNSYQLICDLSYACKCICLSLFLLQYKAYELSRTRDATWSSRLYIHASNHWGLIKRRENMHMRKYRRKMDGVFKIDVGITLNERIHPCQNFWSLQHMILPQWIDCHWPVYMMNIVYKAMLHSAARWMNAHDSHFAVVGCGVLPADLASEATLTYIAEFMTWIL